MKISKKEILKYLKYVLIVGLLFDSVIISMTIGDKESLSFKLLFAFFIITGPSIGYILYIGLENQDKKQEDRRDMIFKGTFEAMFILLPLWYLMKAIKFIQ